MSLPPFPGRAGYRETPVPMVKSSSRGGQGPYAWDATVRVKFEGPPSRLPQNSPFAGGISARHAREGARLAPHLELARPFLDMRGGRRQRESFCWNGVR